MAINFRRFSDGIQFFPKTTSTVSLAGEVDFDTTANKLNLHNGTSSSPIVDESHVATLTNKTIAVGSNSITSTANRVSQFNAGTGILEASAVSTNELGFVSGVTSSIQTQINSKQPTGSYITALTGDVTASGPGSVAATVVTVGGSAASAVNSATIAANAATSANTVSTIVARDGSGNFSAGTITASLTGNVSGTASNVTGIVLPANGGTGIANNNASTITISGNFATTLTVTGTTSITLPTSGTLVTTTATQTLTNKTLTLPIISSISNTGTLTLPTSTDTLVGRDTTDTLTNKTFGDAITLTQITTPSNPAVGFDKIYSKADNNLYILNPAGIETVFSASTPVNSATHLQDLSGYGSIANKIPSFSTIFTNTGSAFTYTKDTVNGDRWTANIQCIVNITFCGDWTTASAFGCSLNSTQLTTAINAITKLNIVTFTTIPSATFGSFSATVPMAPGDILRVHTDGAAPNSNAYVWVTQVH